MVKLCFDPPWLKSATFTPTAAQTPTSKCACRRKCSEERKNITPCTQTAVTCAGLAVVCLNALEKKKKILCNFLVQLSKNCTNVFKGFQAYKLFMFSFQISPHEACCSFAFPCAEPTAVEQITRRMNSFAGCDITSCHEISTWSFDSVAKLTHNSVARLM